MVQAAIEFRDAKTQSRSLETRAGGSRIARHPLATVLVMGRLKRNWKRMALVLGALLLVLLLANAILVWITGNRLEERLSRLRAAGEPITLSDLSRPAPPIEQNAATFLDRARSDIQLIAKEIDAVRAGPNYGHGPLSESDRKKLRSEFDAYPNIVPLLRQASVCSDYQPSVDYSSGPEAVIESFATESFAFNRRALAMPMSRSRSASTYDSFG